MPLQRKAENGRKLLTIHVGGKLVKVDYARLGPAFERLVAQHKKLRLLFDLTGFHGRDNGAMWADFKPGINHFSDIEKLAMVGEKQWQQGMSTFCQPFTSAAVRQFDHADAAEANQWVGEA